MRLRLFAWLAVGLTVLTAARGDPPAPPWVDVAPIVKTWLRADYPAELRAAQEKGRVTVRFVVNLLGAVASARVISSFDVRANAPALGDIRQWTFQPAAVAGQAVASCLDVDIPFGLGDPSAPLPQFPPAAEMPRDLKKTAPVPVAQPAPIYPEELVQSRTAATVTLLLVVDQKGNVLRSRLMNAVDPAFEARAKEVVKSWVFEPALQGGMPVTCLVEADVFFTPR